uniref:Glycosyltransferase 2-like domain-containing protein n=1 Tax=viral metagenome TaxID=1070528 RepID=A0A6C0K4H7_9ZZZZ
MMRSALGIILCSIVLFIILVAYPYKIKEYFENNSKLPISAGVLTYFAPETLKHTLETYKTSEFFECVDDFFVVIQQSDRQSLEKDICEEFNVRYILMPDNGRMASGFKAIYENARNDVLLFLENDFIINGTNEDIRDFLLNSLYFLNEKECDVVRGRSRKQSGDPNYAYINWKDEPPATFVNSTHLAEAIYWDPHPDTTYPSKISRINPIKGNDEWYTTSSKSCNYTNNPYLCKRQFFASEILPHLVDGENIEDRLTPIWAQQNYRCVFGPGLFTHDRSYDGHH